MKRLYWKNEKEISHAKLRELGLTYYITPSGNEYELVLLDQYGNWDNVNDALFERFSSLSMAKAKATNHFKEIIKNFCTH